MFFKGYLDVLGRYRCEVFYISLGMKSKNKGGVDSFFPLQKAEGRTGVGALALSV